MRILGIDPGYAIVGYGVLEFDNTRFKVINYGAITTESDTPFDKRLAEIYDDMCRVLDMFKPDCMSIEKLYFNTNITTGIDVAQARGVTMLAAVQRGVPIYEYTPLQVKVAVTGYGRAEKQQMQEMTKNILHLKEVPKPDDTADALAIAICHGHTGGSKMSEIMRANEVKQLNKKR
ncbi:MAG: crossover junction endodeoxyribonuclease RuvC [Oscillospiraceae bacterium]|nr:crossover junction endodeoxyribonuclease RuvC [Oscillospiraceae bacterium]